MNKLILFSYLLVISSEFYNFSVTSKSNYLLFPNISQFDSILFYSILVDLVINKIDRAMVQLSLFQNFICLLWNYHGINISIPLYVYIYYRNYIYYKFILRSQLIINLIITAININKKLQFIILPNDIFLIMGIGMLVLEYWNTLLIFFNIELKISRQNSIQNADNVTSTIFQVILCYRLINTLLYDSQSRNFKYNTDFNIVLLFSYFLYDTISILLSGRMDKQLIYLAHHIISLYLLCILFISGKNDFTTQNYINKFLLLLEIGNPLLNMLEFYKRTYPKSDSYNILLLLTRCTYLFTRVYIFPLLIYTLYKDNTLIVDTYIFIQIISGLLLIFLASVVWCKHLFSNKFSIPE